MQLWQILTQTYQRHPLTFRIIFYLCLASLFMYRCWMYLDPDFGWHLRLGQLILSNGIPLTDPYSYTMPDYPYIDHEWLVNVLIYIIYSNLGILGLSAIFGLIATLSLVIAVPKKLFTWGIWPTLLGAAGFMVFVGHRPQVFSWLFLSIIIRLIYDSKLWQQYRLYLPIIFIVWANMHGGFALGLALLVLHIVYRFIIEKRWWPLDWIIVFSCLIATFINPYGPRMWFEIYQTMTDQTLSKLIVEWSPMITTKQIWWNPSFWLFSGGTLILTLLNWRQIPKFQILISVLMLIAAYYSRRHLTLAVIATLPVLALAIHLTYQRWVQTRLPNRGKIGIVMITSLIVLVVSISQIRPLIYQEMEDFFYPKLAVKYLEATPINGRILTHYSWGGYLIWKLPEQKVFVDGRMPSWRWEAPEGQSDRALYDYIRLISGQVDIEPYLTKYQIQTVVWPTHRFDKANASSELQGKITSEIQSTDPILKQLQQKGFKLVYQDLVSIILVRKSQN